MLHKLGKIFFLILLTLPLSASVEISAPKHFMEGEALRFQLIAKGFHIKMPEISKIEGYALENIKSSEEAVLINSKKANKITRIYQFFPKSDVTIPSFEILIDNKLETTQAKYVALKKIAKTISENFDFQMKLSKQKAYTTESLTLTITFSYKNLEDYELPELDLPNFITEELSSKEWQDKNGRWIEEISYRLKPQKTGILKLKPLKARVLVLKDGYKNLNNRSKYTQKLSVYSNSLDLDVQALPKELSLVGDYKLFTTINKDKINVGEAITLTLGIEGEGNIDNLDAFKLDIPNTTVYAKQSKRDKDRHLHIKTFDILADQDFTIPSFSLSYFNTKTQTPEVLKSKAFNVKVTNNRSPIKKPHLNKNLIKDDLPKENVTMLEKTLFFVIGSLFTLVLLTLYKLWKIRNVSQKRPPLIMSLKKSTNQETLFKKMVPYIGKDRRLDRLIYLLEGETLPNFKEVKKEILIHMKNMSD